ncbi:MAG: SUMF1/EgtB/PvdO family nonheme iron enzyme [Bacteroidales bacterium]|nr:SUMF1/EgtB/PvdO family nonheme iron enzyme [Bacteroidales bacterium]
MKKRIELIILSVLIGMFVPVKSQNVSYTVNDVSFTMIKVNGGNFMMGNKSKRGGDKYKKERPAHNVTVSTYYIGETEVTQELWQAVMGNNPSYFQGSNRPVEQVSWNDVQEFIKKLNKLTGLNFRLPTEAEWEFAARGGNYRKKDKYSGDNNINAVGWCAENSGMETHDVKTLKPNELGIYDMTGNVGEWCNDWKAPYNTEITINPQGAEVGIFRVLRGGSWVDRSQNCRVLRRDSAKPEYVYSGYGFRLVLSE